MKRIMLAAALCLSMATHAATITDVRIQNTGAAQTAVPVTFGQVFAVGDMKKSDVLVGKLDGAAVPLQVDVKATHADGSVRHAIISAIMPKAGTMQLNTGGVPALAGTTPTDLPSVVASATIGGVKYSASPSGAFKASWLQGPIANEWQTSAPLTTAAGVAHPHLSARFAIRYYGALKKARVDVTVENDWAYQPAPQNFTYDAEVLVGGKTVYAKPALTHLTHARWRKVFWWGGDAPAVNVQLNTKYLIASKAIPNYDQSIVPSEQLLGKMARSSEPMTIGLATAYMPTTGAHDDIGLLPSWQVAYALSMDSRARDGTMATADGSGSFSMHYRDQRTDRPISLVNFPYMTIDGRSTDTQNPATGKYEAFPGPGGDTSSPYTPDTGHHPSLAYLPYLVTGDFYYLEELQFWAMYNVLRANPGYRGNVKGWVISEQLRGQAWALRTLAQAAYATPDADPLKSDLLGFVASNLDWYNAAYTNNTTRATVTSENNLNPSSTGNDLGVIVNGYSIAYNGNTGTAPWMDDFFTSAIGHMVDLGFDKAAPLLAWKAKFPVGRMTDVCWVAGAPYSLTVRGSSDGPFYRSLKESYLRDFGADFMALPCAGQAMASAWAGKMQYTYGAIPGDMGNISDGPMGYPSNMQPALAYAVDSDAPGAKAAWTFFMNRAVKPDYTSSAQFAIVPRSYAATIAPVVAQPALPVALLVAAPTVPGTWAKIANEGAAFTVPAGTFVRYGVGTSWIYSKDSGIGTNGYFGKDPALNTIKTVEAFTPAAPMLAIKATTGSNTKLAKQTGMTVVFLDPVKLSLVKSFTGVTATSKGAFTVSDVLLQPGAQYLVAVISSAGKPLDAFLLTVPK